jgi:RecQ family ATP-dependent DNA helicase
MDSFEGKAAELEAALDRGALADDLTRLLTELRRIHQGMPREMRLRHKGRGRELAERVRLALASRDWTEDMDKALDKLGLESFRAGQGEVIEHVLSGGDALVVMPTGGGKSLTWQVPSLIRPGLTVVISPLIALMQDQQQRMADHGAVMISSAQEDSERERALDDVSSGRAKVVFIAPERLASGAFVRRLAERGVSLLVIDEAHCVSEMGHDFRPDYLRLTKLLPKLGNPQTLALTATATDRIAREITQRLRLREPLVWQGGFDRPNISFDVVQLGGKGSMARKDAILSEAIKREEMTPAIIYCGTRRNTEHVADLLAASGIKAAFYHAGMDKVERARVQDQFMRGEVDAVCATNAFGMGVDKADVRSVWHYTIPSSMESYYQEAGRAGRDGLRSRAIMLSMRSELGMLIRFAKQRQIDLAQVHQLVARLSRTSDSTGTFQLEISDDSERIIVGVLERIGVLDIVGASREGIEGTLAVDELSSEQTRAAKVAIDRAVEMGWEAFRAIERFSATHDTCRREQILAHFHDKPAGEPLGRCCDVHEAPRWLAEVEQVLESREPVKRVRSSSSDGDRPSTKFEDIASDVDPHVLEALREWRAERVEDGKPVYTVCNNQTLAEIARQRPDSLGHLGEIKGIGPSFLEKHAPSLLATLNAL